MTRNVCFIALLSAAAFAAPSRADDLSPPPWRLGAGTTVQHWDFNLGLAVSPPDALPLNNPYGAPMLTASTGSTWFPALNGRNHVWDISGGGNLNFDVPNTGNTAHLKNLWLQVTFFGLAPTTGPAVVIGGSTGPFTMVGAPVNTPLAGGWTHQLSIWTVPVCPQFERVAISPPQVGAVMAIDQVVIDTQCIVPAPGVASALGLAGLCAWRRRRPASA